MTKNKKLINKRKTHKRNNSKATKRIYIHNAGGPGKTIKKFFKRINPFKKSYTQLNNHNAIQNDV